MPGPATATAARLYEPVGALAIMRCSGVIIARCALLLCVLADAFVPQAPSMSSAPDSHYRPARLEKTGPPAPFATFSSSGSNIDEAFSALGRIFCDEVGEELEQQQEARCAMGIVFFSRGEHVDVPQDPMRYVPHEDAGGVENALARLHDSLPFVNDIIASPARATSTSKKPEQEVCTQGKPAATVTVTLAFFHNQGVTIRPFVLHPVRELDRHCDRLLRGDAIGSHVGESLERSGRRRNDVSRGVENGLRGHHRTVCLAFGGEVSGTDSRPGGGPCTENLCHLNEILRDAGRARGSLRDGASRCPLVSTATSAGPVFVSARDGRSGERVTVAADAVGAILTCLPESDSSFHLVHAGDDMPLQSSQFRVASVDGGIAEVVPVEPKRTTTVSTPGDHDVGQGAGAGSFWQRPRLPCGVISAAEWCKQVVASSTRFEKVAMQSALGVGVLKRAGSREEAMHDRVHSTSAPAGVTRHLPAHGCLPVVEVNVDGSISLALNKGARGNRREAIGATGDETVQCDLRAGDLCDIRAMGTVAAMQAEEDAYSWMRISRLSALIQSARDGGSETCPSLSVPAIQGCLTAASRTRFVPGSEGESCEELVRVAAGHGGCPTAGMVGDAHFVSIDNVMMTCSSDMGTASVYVCGNTEGNG